MTGYVLRFPGRPARWFLPAAAGLDGVRWVTPDRSKGGLYG